MRQREATLTGTNGLALFVRCWLPEGEPRAATVVAHGLAEHGGRYAGLARRLVDRGHLVYALDHRGHGRSPGRRANIERFAWVVDDLTSLVDEVRREHPGLPVTLLGHSMGGAIALDCALRRQDVLHTLVLSAPALGADPATPRLRLALVRLLSRWLPDVGALKLPATAISRDPVVVRAYESDPLVFRGAIPARTLAELLEAMNRLPQLAPRLSIPVLVMHGTADQLVRLVDVERVYERLGSADRTVRTYDGLYHEVFNEPERNQVLGDLVAWLDAHL